SVQAINTPTGTTVAATTGVSAAGWGVGTAVILPRASCACDISKVSVVVRRMTLASNNVSTAAATAPTLTRIAGIWVNTSAPIQFLDLTSYAAMGGTSLQANLLTGTEFAVWGSDI